MKKTGIRKMILSAVLAAFVFAATIVIHFPSPTGGCVNFGDTVVLISAYILGPWWGAAAAGIGSALADIIGGHIVYVLPTLVIKSCMAIAAHYTYRTFGKRIIAGAVAEAIMVAGYWLYDGFLMDNLIAAAIGIPANLIQATAGIIGSTLLAIALRKKNYL